MPINPQIAMGVQPMQIQNPMNQLAQYAQIQQGQQANQLGQMQMEEYKRARQEEDQVRNYLSQGADLNSPEAQRALLGMGKSGMGLLTNLQAQQKSRIEQVKALQEVAGKSLGGIVASPDINTAFTRVTAFGKATGTDVTPYIKELQQIGNNPEGIRQWAASHWQDVKDLLPKLGTMDTGGQIVPYSQNPLTGAVTQAAGGVKKVMSPGEAARLAQDRAQFQTTQNAPVFNQESQVWVTKPVNGVSGVIPVAGLENSKPLTESQGNAVAYGMRMAETNKLLKELESTGLKDTGKIRAGVGGTVGAIPLIGDSLSRGVDNVFNVLPSIMGGLSEDQQKNLAARVNFITASLRKESGASISPSEFINEEKKYFPAPGDTAAVIKQKQDARETAIKAMKIQAGRGSKEIDKHVESIAGQNMPAKNSKGYVLHVDANGNKAYVGPNGQIEEVK